MNIDHLMLWIRPYITKPIPIFRVPLPTSNFENILTTIFDTHPPGAMTFLISLQNIMAYTQQMIIMNILCFDMSLYYTGLEILHSTGIYRQL
ncbi:hypothetical protein H5410_046828 [Solanum commersonii]|uniref:Uncharacterized protein n=1 Tax=Solanum commersonii TaxID=4109 RepID=A0A9J5XFG2_SOLCO|nr:hypothetical protein H5410_046828 [Solanum commersonii]